MNGLTGAIKSLYFSGGAAGGAFNCLDLRTCPINSLSDINTAGNAVGDVLTWDGSFWVNNAAGGPAWLLGGNLGTTPGINFLGTTDTAGLTIQTDSGIGTGAITIGNNASAASPVIEIGGNSTAGTDFNILVGHGFTGLGDEHIQLGDSFTGNEQFISLGGANGGTGLQQSIYIGRGYLGLNNQQSIGIGSLAQGAGIQVINIGDSSTSTANQFLNYGINYSGTAGQVGAMFDNFTGGGAQSITFGTNFASATGGQGIDIGSNNGTTSTQNINVGNTFTGTGDQNLFLGPNFAGNNQVIDVGANYIGTGAQQIKVGTNVAAASTLLFGGTLQLESGTDSERWPTVLGLAGQVLTTDGLGVMSWQNPTGGFTCTDLNACSIDALSDVDTTTTPPTTGEALVWDGTNWVNTILSRPSLSTTPETFLFGQSVYMSLTGNFISTAEADTVMNMPSGNLSDIRLNIETNTLDQDMTLEFRQNGVTTAQVLITVGTTGPINTPQALAITAGDLCNLRANTLASTLGDITITSTTTIY